MRLAVKTSQMLYFRDMKAQRVPRVGPYVMLRATSIMFSYLLMLNGHYNQFVEFNASLKGESLQNSNCTLVFHWRIAVNTGTIGHGYTRARTHGFLRSHGASKWSPAGTGVRRARTGGGIRDCRWGWTGTGERTDGSSAGSKRASRALFPIFSSLVPLFFLGFPSCWDEEIINWGSAAHKVLKLERVRVSSTFSHNNVPLSLSQFVSVYFCPSCSVSLRILNLKL